MNQQREEVAELIVVRTDDADSEPCACDYAKPLGIYCGKPAQWHRDNARLNSGTYESRGSYAPLGGYSKR